MIGFMIVLCLIIISFISFVAKGRRKNFLLIFNVWWSFWVLLSVLNLTNLFEVSDRVYIIVFFSVFFTNIIDISLPNKKSSFNKIRLDLSFFILCFLFLYTVITLYLIVRMYNLIDGNLNNYWMVRSIFWSVPINGDSTNLFNSKIFGSFYHLLTFFLQIAFLYSLLIYLEFGRKNLIILTIVSVILYCVLAAARNLIIMNVFVVLVYVVKTGNVKRLKNIIFIMFLFIITMTAVRNNGLTNLFNPIITYFTGSLVFFDVKMDSIDNYSYGNILLSQLFMIFYKIIAYIGFDVSSEYFNVSVMLQENTRIALNHPYYDFYNALPTWMFFAYKDFGYFGVIIYPLCFYVLYGWFIRKINYEDCASVLMLCYLEVVLLWTIFKPIVFDMSVVITIIIYAIATRIKTKE